MIPDLILFSLQEEKEANDKEQKQTQIKPMPYISLSKFTPPHKFNPDSRIHQLLPTLQPTQAYMALSFIVSANCLQTSWQIKESSIDVLQQPSILFYPEAFLRGAQC